MASRTAKPANSGSPKALAFLAFDMGGFTERFLPPPLLLAAVAALLAAGKVCAYTPGSPEVRSAVAKGVKYLEKVEFDKNTSEPMGRRAILGLAVLKAGEPPSHPTIAEAVSFCRATLRQPKSELEILSNYDLFVAAYFLCELDPQTYRSEIERFLSMMYARQTPQGAWTYAGFTTGDTSQTQFAVLALWSAANAGFPVPNQVLTGVAGWHIRTQDPSGAWGYQGDDSGAIGKRVKQLNGVRHTMVLAGLSSAYILADLFGAGGASETKSNLPPALRKVEPQKFKTSHRSFSHMSALRSAMADGKRWLSQNYTISPKEYPFYYLLALERYGSFLELVEGVEDPEPKWYNDGVEFLLRGQGPDGAWPGQVAPEIATALAILFLTRSTRASIESVEGTLRGGRGLPKDTSQVRMQGGNVVGTQVAQSVDDLLAALSDPDNPALAGLDQIELATRGPTDAERLRALVSHPTWEARLVAVRALGEQRDFSNVPVLIYALTDPDWRVVKEAHGALRFVSRKLTAINLPAMKSEPKQREAVKYWKAWYRSIYPDARFLD